MTNNMDEFDQDVQEPLEPRKNALRQNLTEAWRTNPALKLMAIMAVVGIALVLTFGVFSTPQQETQSSLGSAPTLDVAPGSKASPFLVEQNTQANAQRAEQAIHQGGSVMPTPIGRSVDLIDPTEEGKSKDPLMEFRAETERLRQELKQEQRQSAQQLQLMQQQVQAPPPQPVQAQPFDESLAQAMQQQLKQVMDSWALKGAKVVQGVKEEDKPAAQGQGALVANGGAATQVAAPAAGKVVEKPLVLAGTVNYAQMLMEANSDVQGPIMAQILSGPLAGARAIGSFQVENDYLVIRFTTATLKGKEYAINALALDPETTLGGMATEVDHRYFSRVVLPAAGKFVSAFASAMSHTETITTVSNGAVVVSQARQGLKDALYAGAGSAGDSVANFLAQEGANIRPLVRVAVGTPLGLFFLTSVKKDGSQSDADRSLVNNFFATDKVRQATEAGGQVGYYNPMQTSYPGYSPYGAFGSSQRYPSGVSVLTTGQGNMPYYGR